MSNNEPDRAHRLELNPHRFELGVTFQGAILEGTFHISPATEIREIHVNEYSQRVVLEGLKQTMYLDPLTGDNMLELSQNDKQENGSKWRFRIRTERPVDLFARVVFETDIGSTSTRFTVEVKEGPPPGGKILFFDSLFGFGKDSDIHENLNLLTRELQVQVNTTDELPDDLSPFHTIVLHGLGLRWLVEADRGWARLSRRGWEDRRVG